MVEREGQRHLVPQYAGRDGHRFAGERHDIVKWVAQSVHGNPFNIESEL
jgi:hypothetical protein